MASDNTHHDTPGGQQGDLRIDCDSCPVSLSTACNDCVVGHLLANDGGPIDMVVVREQLDPTSRAVELFVVAGLVDDPPAFVDPVEFASPGSPARGPTLAG